MESAATLDARFVGLLREHRKILLKIAASFASEAEEQADLFQDMAVEIWRSLPRFRGEAKASTWIYRTCLNTALSWRRSELKRRFPHAPLEFVPELSCGRPLPGRAEEQDEILRELYRAIRALPAGERSLTILLLDGLSYREIAEITGLTENHVGVALTRARKKLAESLKEVRHEL
jgi:RNA polymerase sigma-70 factor (ECF subfamily)